VASFRGKLVFVLFVECWFMGIFFRTLKSFFFWRHGRTAWQYDVLCVLILAFIFLTPKSWFENGERTSAQGHQIPLERIYLPVTEAIIGPLNATEIERRVRDITGRPDARVISTSPKADNQGKTVAYEVDIR
jgi:hypothetical protein